MALTYRPLFGTGTARTGAGLVCRMISVHPEVVVASDPYLEIFRSLRNAILREAGDQELMAWVDPAGPLPDGYFDERGIRLLDVMGRADADVRVEEGEWSTLLPRLAPRTELECADLIPHLAELRGPTYRAVIDNALDIIASVRGPAGAWVGIKECWTVEFFPLLARTYPDARFFIVLRDPRATTASMLAVERTYPEQVVHPLSWLRHWRKYAAFVSALTRDPLFAERLIVIRHEDVVREPVAEATRLCEFLDIPFLPELLDTDNYIDFSTGGIWLGNSAFEPLTTGINPQRAERWRTSLSDDVLELIEFVCGPEMLLTGYEPLTDALGAPGGNVLRRIVDDNDGTFNWRTDFADPQLDYGFELFRRALLETDPGLAEPSLVRRSFLFGEVYSQIRERSAELQRSST